MFEPLSLILRYVDMKGKGSLLTYWLTGEEASYKANRLREREDKQKLKVKSCFLRSVSQRSSNRSGNIN